MNRKSFIALLIGLPFIGRLFKRKEKHEITYEYIDIYNNQGEFICKAKIISGGFLEGKIKYQVIEEE